MIIFRYLTKEILTKSLATCLALIIIFVTNQSVQFLQRAASGQLPATELLQVIAYEIPLSLGYLLPLAFYLGVLLTFARLYLDSEMTVLSACGVSRAKLICMVMLLAVVVALFVAWLMGSIVPKAQGDINIILNDALVTASVQQVIPRRFMQFGKSGNRPIIFYASSVENHAMLHDVFMARQEVDKKEGGSQKWDVIVAKTALEKEANAQGEKYLLFNHGYRYSGTPGEKNYHVMRFDQYAVRILTESTSHLNAAQYYSLSTLWALRNTNMTCNAELQWRMAMPISVLVFGLLALPLCEIRPRYGKFMQLFPALLLYVSYADLIFLCRAWIRAGKISPQVGMWWVHGIIVLIALLLMLYQLGWHRFCALFSRKKML